MAALLGQKHWKDTKTVLNKMEGDPHGVNGVKDEVIHLEFGGSEVFFAPCSCSQARCISELSISEPAPTQDLAEVLFKKTVFLRNRKNVTPWPTSVSSVLKILCITMFSLSHVCMQDHKQF